MFKVNIKTLEQRCEICSKLTIKPPKRRRCHFGGFIVNFEHISHLCSSIYIVIFEQVNAGWDYHNHFFSAIKFIHHFENVYKTLSFQRNILIRLVKFWGSCPTFQYLFGPVIISYHTNTETCLRERFQS